MFFVTLLCSGCYYLQKANVPVESIWYRQNNHAGRQADHLFILLPGLGDLAGAFEKRGLVDYMRKPDFANGFAFDLVAVNAHFKYYSGQTLIERLKSDIVDPAKIGGYKHIHFIGISLGGFGSLLYLRDYPDDISTITILAPYLGEKEYYQHLFDERLRTPENLDKKNIWPWLETMPEETRRKIFLGYGDEDKFAPANSALAALLPPEHTLVVAGRHRWTTWQQIWPGLLVKVKEKVVGNT